MSNYATLKSAIQSAVYTNGNGEITGAGLQAVLLQIVNTVGDGYVFKGVATPGTSPGTPDDNVFYIAPAGTYTNFGSSYTVKDGEIGVFTYDGSWAHASVKVENYANEVNVSVLFPTGSPDSDDRYTFAQAVAKIPVSMRNVGVRLTYTDKEGISQTWVKYRNFGSFDSAGSWYNADWYDTLTQLADCVGGVDDGVATHYDDTILTENGYIDGTGEFVANVSYRASLMTAIPTAPSMNGGRRYARVKSRTAMNGAVMSVAFYDSMQNFIGGKGVQSLVNGFNAYNGVVTVRIPEDAVYFRACGAASDMFSLSLNVSVAGHVNDIYDGMDGLSDEIAAVDSKSPMYRGFDTAYSTHYDDSILTVADTYVNAAGAEVSSVGYCCSPLTALPVKPIYVYGDYRLIRIRSRVNLNASLSAIAFYDGGQNFIGTQRTPCMLSSYNYNDAVDALYIAPPEAVYFRVSERQVAPYIFSMTVDVAANGIIGKVIEHEQVIYTMTGMHKPTVWLPKNMYMLRGIKSQLFTSGMVCAQDSENVHLNILYGSGMTSLTAKGYNRGRVFEWTPSAGDSDQVYRFGYQHDFFGKNYAPNATTLHNVVAKSSPLSNRNVLCMGDSFTDHSWWVSEINHLLTGHTDSYTDPDDVHGNDGLTNITFIGTQDTSSTPNEGYSGKSYQWFCSSSSPFYYGGDVNFTAYCTAHGFSGIDIAVILLGTNGGNGEQYVRKIWDKLLEHNPSIKVLVLGRCFAAPYGAGTAGMGNNQDWYSLSEGVQTLNAWFESLTENDDYSGNFLFVEYSACMDIANNMPWAEVSANDRRTDVKVRQATDNVHPSKYGYWQIADAVRGAFHYWCI